MGLNWKQKALLAKIEATYGTDSVPTAAANGILAVDVSLNPMEGQDVSRNLERPFLGAQPSVPVDLHTKLSFRVELAASGTAGTAPAWGVLLRGCGLAQTIVAGTSVTFSPVSSGFESLSIYMNIGGIRYVLLGARGKCRIEVEASGIPYLVFEFMGFFTQPTDTALPSPTLTAFQTPLVATRTNTPTFTLNTVALILRRLVFDMGQVITPRFLIGPQTAPLLSNEMLIEDFAEKVDMTIEQVPLTTFNPFALAAAQTQIALALQHGTVAGNRITLNVARLQLMRPATLENRQGVVEQPLSGMPLPLNGNDQYSIVCT